VARLIVILGLVVCASPPALAVRIVVRPKVLSTCREHSSWSLAVTCMSRFGKVRPERMLAKAHIVAVDKPDDMGTDRYLYLLGSDDKWRFAGQLQDAATITALVPVAVPGGERFRVDFVKVFESAVAFEDHSAAPSMTTMYSTMFCAPDRIGGCSIVVTRCEDRVRGKTVQLFLGDLTLDHGTAIVRGDSTKLGTCTGGPRTVAL
jgi:hypothetical protein